MAIAGKDGKVMIGAATVAEVTSWKLDIGADMLDSTTLTKAWKEFVAGLKEWSGNVECNWNVSGDAAGQKAFQDAMLGGTTVAIKLYVNATTYYSGTAYLSKQGVADGVTDLVGVSFDIQGTGALTYT